MKHTHQITLVGLLSLFCVLQAQADLSGRFITSFGEIASSDCPWAVSVSATNQTFHISYHYTTDSVGSGVIGVSSPAGWKARSGWFVFVENDERVWAYDGDKSLFLQVGECSKSSKSGPTCTSYGPHTFPCGVPDAVLKRLTPDMIKAIKSDKI